MPSARPTHCRNVTRSPSSRLASVEVSTGCRLTTSAANPAGQLVVDRDRTRRRDSSHAPADRSPRCAACPARDGQAGRVSRMIAPSSSTTARHAHGEEGHRLGVRQAELGADEARGPQQHEHGRRREHGSIGERCAVFGSSRLVCSGIFSRRPVPRISGLAAVARKRNPGCTPLVVFAGNQPKETTMSDPRFRDPRFDPAAAARRRHPLAASQRTRIVQRHVGLGGRRRRAGAGADVRVHTRPESPIPPRATRSRAAGGHHGMAPPQNPAPPIATGSDVRRPAHHRSGQQPSRASGV